MYLGKKISDVYVHPLPYKVSPLPVLILHNPISILHWLYVYFLQRTSEQRIHRADYDHECHVFKVLNSESMIALWQQGFFGKGTLSRSEPSWFGRTARRLGLDGGEISLEELTEQRRTRRRQIKKEREVAERRELNAKRAREGLPLLPDLERPMTSSKPDPELHRTEDLALIIGDTIQRLEYLQLTPSEALYLSGGIGVLDVYNGDSKLDLGELAKIVFDSPSALREYVTYHYFRSLGWCVRDGVKFGTNLLLYRKGPPFHHAEFGVIVAGPEDQYDWYWLHQTLRVVSGVRKALMIVYVDVPDTYSVESATDLRRLLARCAVQPVLLSRWAPNRTRD